MRQFQKKQEFVPKYEQPKKTLYAEPKFMLPPDATKLPKPFAETSSPQKYQESATNNKTSI